ncbi:MAG: hypothetical protein J6P44_00605 [Bacteroidales bacterium]|nr:hypothetical protein [Bacteroidales bacterium]
MAITNFAQDVLKEFDNQITDAVFCFIQQNRELMNKYLDLIAEVSADKQQRGLDTARTLKDVNSHIAQEIARHYNLRSVDQDERPVPNSTLILSYSQLE